MIKTPASNALRCARAAGRRLDAAAALSGLSFTLAAAAFLTLVFRPHPLFFIIFGFFFVWSLAISLKNTELTLRSSPPASPELESRVVRLARRLGIHSPQVHVVGVNEGKYSGPRRLQLALGAASANDLTPSSTVVIGEYTLRGLHRNEEDAVLAHELAHLAHTPLWSSVTRLISDCLWVSLFYLFPFALFFSPDRPALMVIPGLVSLMLCTAARRILGAWFSRKSELAADATAAALTSGSSLAAALVRVAMMNEAAQSINLEECLSVEDELEEIALHVKGSDSFLNKSTLEKVGRQPWNLYADHPTLKTRIEQLIR